MAKDKDVLFVPQSVGPFCYDSSNRNGSPSNRVCRIVVLFVNRPMICVRFSGWRQDAPGTGGGDYRHLNIVNVLHNLGHVPPKGSGATPPVGASNWAPLAAACDLSMSRKSCGPAGIAENRGGEAEMPEPAQRPTYGCPVRN